jgi:glycosyltransferase involved in cell wall biosynthesis
MKIFFISNYSQLYGANRSLLTLIEYFHENNNSVFVLLPSKGAMSEKLTEKGIKYYTIPYYSSFLYFKMELKYLSLPFLMFFNFFSYPFIFWKIKSFNPDLIYSNTSAENIGVFFAKLLNIKHISHIREFMNYDHGSFFILGKKLKRKFINLSDGVIFVSKSVKNEITKGRNFSSKNSVIYNGLPLPYLKIKSKSITKKISFGIVGALDPGKGQLKAVLYFKSILESYPNSKLNIFGDKKGNYKNKILKLIKKLEIENNVIFHGFVNNQNEIYNQLDVLLMFSRSEGFGRVTAEAMMRGVLVVGYDNAGTSELINNKVTGCLFNDFVSF